MTNETIKERIYSIDFLRGVVMMIMLLDHTRDFIHAGAMTSDPTDLTTTTPALFFTRWITHFSAPTFVFLSGISIYLQRLAGKTNAELSKFLLTRGLWLIILEFTLVRFAIVFNFDYTFFGMAQVIWVIGVCMIVMAALIFLPVTVVGIFGLAVIFLHNVLDLFQVPPNIAFGGTPLPDLSQSLWIILHQPGIVHPFGGASIAFVPYPVIPWLGVMAAGFAFGTIYAWDREKRRKWLLIFGVAATALYIIIRLINVYGDPAPWSPQDTPVFTILSFLNTTKYGPSLLYLLMTLGPAMIVLGLTERIDGKAVWQRVAIVFGRVPLFFYILQWFTAHGLAVLLTMLAGKDAGYLYKQVLESGQFAPPDYGFPLWVVYAAWITGLLILYPLCKWYGNIKRQKKYWILSYL